MPETNPSNETPHVFGRALADFQPLKTAEQQLLDACRTDQTAEICATRPEPGQTEFEVRAAFIRFLALGGDAQAPVHERGVSLQGAWISGELDLNSCSVNGDLCLDRCTFDQPVALLQASVKTLSFRGSALVGLIGDRMQAAGDLCLRSDDDQRFICRGEVRLLGAKISGDLDIDGADLIGAVALLGDGMQVSGAVFMRSNDLQRFNCRGTIRLLGARIGGNLELDGAELVGAEEGTGDALNCDGMQVDGYLFLRSNNHQCFNCHGTIQLLNSRIGRNLELTGASLIGADDGKGNALIGDGMQVSGAVFMRSNDLQRFNCRGTIRLLGAKIGGDLEIGGAELVGADDGKGNALRCDGMQVSGGVFMRSHDHQQFNCRGTIRLAGATIGGDLYISGAELIGADNGKGDALSCDRMQVSSGLFMRSGENFEFSCSGRANVGHAKVGILIDDLSCWPSEIVLDGFTFDALGGRATPEPQARVQWLKRQPTKHLTTSFRPQPWTHLIKTLRRMGYKREAAEVGVAYQRQRRAAGRIGPNWHPRRILHWLYELFCGYGYQPLHAVYWLAGVWLLSGLLYWYAAEQGVFAPSQAPIANNAAYAPCRPDRPLPENAYRNWYNCPALPASDYPTFAPFAYSLDVILPAVDLQQERLWAPAAPTFTWPPPNNRNFWLPTAVRWLMWFEILFGWTLSGLLLAVLSGLAKPEGTE